MNDFFYQQPSLAREEILDVLQLIRSEQVGSVTFFNLVSFYGSVPKAMEAIPELAKRGGRKKPLKLAERKKVEQEYQAVLKFGGTWLKYGDPHYPSLLTAASDAPPVIAVLGNPELLAHPRPVAIVGARNASGNGCSFANKMARELGEQGCCVISGLARGIDTAAHRGALATGTIAVIAGGLDHIYPPENESLYKQIAEQGAIIAEAPFGSSPQARHFPARNRIIAGMSSGTVVMEASRKSGSLITANMALDYGREVFAVPGSPMDPRSEGANSLIKQGAQLTQSAQDVLDNLRAIPVPPLREAEASGYTSAPPSLDDAQYAKHQEVVMQCLSSEPIAIEMLTQ
ncbi:MAG: DNA-protecting protein DprA, partial [Rickettsiales bacterium]|nr:DNA-protecting protein DprA [Rickettsiales bacterium]